MSKIRVPWYVGAPAFVGTALVVALTLNYLLSDYFIRTFVDEADPLADVSVGSKSDGGEDVTPAVAGSTAAATATGPASPTATPSSPVQSSSPGTAQATPAAATAEPTIESTPENGPGIISVGTFRNGDPGHIGSGSARVLRDPGGKLFLRFEDFSVTNGPDLRVYLSTTDGYSGDSLELGKLKGTDGNQNYEIPAGVDPAAFRSAVIWCEPFSVLFAIATLEVAP